MDRKTQEYLMEIGLNMPERLKKALMRTEKSESYTDIMERFLFTDIPEKDKDIIREGIRTGAYAGKQKYVNDPKAAALANQYFQDMIEKGIRQGKIERPKADEFMYRMREKLNA